MTNIDYEVERNNCRCHPETCCCDDWAIISPTGEKHSTYFHKSTAEEIAALLNQNQLLKEFKKLYDNLQAENGNLMAERNALLVELSELKAAIARIISD